MNGVIQKRSHFISFHSQNICEQCRDTILIVIVWEEWISEMKKKMTNDGSKIQLWGDENNLQLVVTVRHEGSVYGI